MRVIARSQLSIKQIVENDESVLGQPHNQKGTTRSECEQVESNRMMITSTKQCQAGVCGIDESWLSARCKSNKNS